MSLTFHDGRLRQAAEVQISPSDAGFLFGDGLFETLRVDNGQARDVEAHLDRLLAGLGRIGIDLPEDRAALEQAIAAVSEAGPRPVARLRITVTRGPGEAGPPTRLITAAPYAPPSADLYRNGVPARLLPHSFFLSQGPLAGLKSISYQAHRLALRQAEARGDWEVLLVNERGLLVEGSRTNLALVLPEGIFTPPLFDGCLPGTVRRRLIERGVLVERSLGTADLDQAAEVLLMNSLIGVLPVSRIDDRSLLKSETAARLRSLLP